MASVALAQSALTAIERSRNCFVVAPSTLRASARLAALAVLGALIGIPIACSEQSPSAGQAGGTLPPSAETCPNGMGCPCANVGEKVACGKTLKGDHQFLYCYQGARTCLPTGAYGDCVEGQISTRSISTLRPAALASSSVSCNAVTSGPLLVCVAGKRQGEFCSVNGDCGNGKKKCTGSTDSTQNCKDDSDCNVECARFNGECAGGPTPNVGCNVTADCGVGGTCSMAGGGNLCGTYVGICDSAGPEDGEACNADADCGAGGQCKGGNKGVCIGGKKSGRKCKLGRHCKGGGICTADTGDAGAAALNPCDPYCQVYGDTPIGFDAGAGFQLVDGGLTTSSTSVCGDGTIGSGEQCDDGNAASGDGCNSTCQLEPGFYCPTPGSPCVPSTCGNGVQEGLEQCDDGNLRPYDGCSPTCTREVTCPAVGPCVAVCGDGIKFPSEACDDGNTTNGDGCSSTCTVEPSATCTTVTAASPPYIDVPVIYRDFRGDQHPDFQKYAGVIPHNVPPVPPYNFAPGINCAAGLVQGIPTTTLGADKQPVFNATQNCTANAGTFFHWFHDTPGVNQVILGRKLRLFQSGAAYVFNSTTDNVTTANINCGNGTAVTCQSQGGFWPLNGLGFGNWAATGKNFHFTSEVRFPFTYAGGETLSFTGDDDVFVYVGGRKVVDLGGVHAALSGSVTLNAGTVTVPGGAPVGLVVGQTYEIAVFQTERNTTGSNYRLTLQGFNRTTSQCTAPPPPATTYRDFEGVCPIGTRVVWQLFRFKAQVPAGSVVNFRAATQANPAALPTSATDPSTVPVGAATDTNSPVGGPIDWDYDPTPVSARLSAAAPPQASQQWLRVFMTFAGTPILYEWQQLYDCVPAE